MIDFRSLPGFAAFRGRLLDQPTDDVARMLYGPGWRTALIDRSDEYRMKLDTRRLPKTGDARKAFDPLLLGVVAHDQRSSRHGRQLGWWCLSDDAWSPAHPPTLRDALTEAVDAVLDEITARHAAKRAPLAAAADRDAMSACDREAECRRALVDALRGFITSNLCLAQLLDTLRPVLTLSHDAQDVIFREALSDLLLGDEYRPGESITPAELYRVLGTDDAGEAAFPLRRRDFFATADRVLGRRRSHDARYYEIPDPDGRGPDTDQVAEELPTAVVPAA